jgi:predicted nucleic acid-binding protein
LRAGSRPEPASLKRRPDTNVMVTGLLSPTGNEALILLAIYQGLVHPCFSK